MVTFTREELGKRFAGDYEGAEVLALWRRFAWTRTGAPKKDFELTSDAILAADATIRAKMNETP